RRVDHQSGAIRDGLLETGSAPSLAQRYRAPVLPDDRVMYRPAARALPQHRGFALIGDADRRNRPIGRRDHLAAGRNDAGPDLFRVMLDPAGLRIMLRELDAGGVMQPPGGVEQDRAGAGRSLI